MAGAIAYISRDTDGVLWQKVLEAGLGPLDFRRLDSLGDKADIEVAFAQAAGQLLERRRGDGLLAHQPAAEAPGQSSRRRGVLQQHLHQVGALPDRVQGVLDRLLDTTSIDFHHRNHTHAELARALDQGRWIAQAAGSEDHDVARVDSSHLDDARDR